MIETAPRSLAVQFLLFLSAIMLIGFVGIVYMQYRSQSSMNTENIQARAESLGGLMASISVQPLLVHDFVTLNEYVENTGSQKDVAFVVVTDPGSEILAYHINNNHPEGTDALKLQDVGRYSGDVAALQDQGLIYSYQQPIQLGRRNLGMIYIGLDRRPANQQLMQSVTNMTIVIFVIWFIAGLGIYLAFRFRVSDPIEMVAGGARDIANLKFDTVVPVRSQNEIGQLALSFNEMRMQLKNAVEERNRSMLALQELNLSLEERVNQRTSELQTLNREVAYQAVHDPLTGLPNRLLITERLKYALKQSHRDKLSFAVLMVDLDNFKEVNDTLGHHIGDELLRQVAGRLVSAVRETDTVGRLGGDEFALILLDVDEQSAMQVAEKINHAMLQNFKVDGHALASSGSIGIALHPEHGNEYTALLRCADIAMYAAKRNNSKVSLYDPDSDKHSIERLSLVSDLRVALEEHQLELHYQPIVDLVSGRVTGVEALSRWNHARYGPISPTEFIPIAENTNLIKPLTRWVMETAAAQWQEWQKSGLHLQVSINLSMINLLDPELPHYIAQLREETKIPVNALKLEITESEIMSNPERVIKVMNHEYMSGIRYSVDDFGTGYSSLSYLKKLPVQEVKIDRSFVTSMAIDAEDFSIVCAVVELAHSLGLDVVAEGVEDHEVMRMLIKLGCEYAQGYYFSRPLPGDRILELIAQVESLYRDSALSPALPEPSLTH